MLKLSKDSTFAIIVSFSKLLLCIAHFFHVGSIAVLFSSCLEEDYHRFMSEILHCSYSVYFLLTSILEKSENNKRTHLEKAHHDFH